MLGVKRQFDESGKLNSSAHDANNHNSSQGKRVRDVGGKRNDNNNNVDELFNDKLALARSNQMSDECRRSEGDISEASDDWHLLEVGDQSSGDEACSTRGQIVVSKRQGSGRSNMKPTTTSADLEEQFVDIEPANGAHRYSPVLSHICTASYSLILPAGIFTATLLVALVFTRYWFLTLSYLAYILWDRNTSSQGGCRNEAFCDSKYWAHLAAYFPIKLRHSRQFKLDPKENYLLNYHPHGIHCFGCVSAFGSGAFKFGQLFPGITARFLVHETSFMLPIVREFFSLRGDCSVSSKSIDYLLGQKRLAGGRSGHLLALVGGGLAEANLSDAQTMRIVLANRKGFIKKALIHGAHLIPCIAFGENSVLTRVNFQPRSFMHRLEAKCSSLLKFKHPIFYGQSIFSNNLRGFMPYKRPITVVMGDPILVDRVETPSQEQVDGLHSHYVAQVQKLYAANKDLRSKFDQSLEFI